MLCTCSMNSTGSEVHERAGADAGCAVWRVVWGSVSCYHGVGAIPTTRPSPQHGRVVLAGWP